MGHEIWKIPLFAVLMGWVAIFLMRSLPAVSTSSFHTPLGVVPLRNGVPFQPPLRNGYLKLPPNIEGAGSATVYRISLSVERINPFVDRLTAELLPAEHYAVVVASNFDEQRADAEEVTFLTDFRARSELVEALEGYRFRLAHDGFVGFGFAWYDRDNPVTVEEVFVTPKKIILIRTTQDDLVDRLLAEEGIPVFDEPSFITDYATAVTDLRGCNELFGDRYPQFHDDRFLTSVYLPELLDSIGFEKK